MSEIEHATYIFGSFSRSKRQPQQDGLLSPKQRSYNRNSVSSPVGIKPQVRISSDINSVKQEIRHGEDDDDTICDVCKRTKQEPRVLECLHSFCTNCLHEILNTESNRRKSSLYEIHSQGSLSRYITNDNSAAVARDVNIAESTGSSGNSGYESEVHIGSGSDASWTPPITINGRKTPEVIICPTCEHENKLPLDGVTGLPFHYVLQHRMLVQSLNQDVICLLCDLCSTDVPAITRCAECLLNLCTFCSEAHKRQRVTSDHEMVVLTDSRQRGSAITKIRRQIMCSSHPDNELKFYCNQCHQVVCRECCYLLHRGHNCDVSSRAAHVYTSKVRDAVEKTRQVNSEAVVAVDRLNMLSQRIQLRCSQVQSEVDRFIDSYIKALEDHRMSLHKQINQAREAKLQALGTHQDETLRRERETAHVLKFGQELLNEGSDIEVLTFVSPLLRRMEWCAKSSESTSLPQLRVLETLNFLPEERAGNINNRQMYGVVSTQTVSPAHSFLTNEALNALNNCRQLQKCEITLLTKDCDDQPICHGAEKVNAELRYRDATQRQITTEVYDCQDGAYIISFVPDSSGNMILSVTVKGLPIKGSPFPVCVRTIRAHHGIFHCCSFCSSGGNKDVTCGCNGRMPGGYRGCGHGHTGHPGRRHWSCCGSVLHNSECNRSTAHSALYQFTL